MTQAAAAIVAAVLLACQMATPETGVASQYAPGKMEKTVANRQAGLTAYDLPNPLPAVDGFIAVAC